MKYIYILLICLCAPAIGLAAVCTAGSGVDECTVSQTGISADYSAATFNALSGDFSDDTFYFSGDFTTPITVGIYGTSGHPVTLDGF